MMTMKGIAPINSMVSGSRVRVRRMNFDLGIKKKLMEMGIFANVELTLIDKRRSGYVIISTRYFRLACDDFIAKNILVEAVE